MKKALIAGIVVLSLVLAGAAFAGDAGTAGNVTGPTFDQKKTDILKRLDEQIASMQEAKTCIQSAKTDDDIRTCREKHRAEMMDKRGDMKQRGMGSPGGPMGR